MEPIKITCPDCKCVLIIDRREGKIIEKRPPIIKETTGDRFKDAYIKVQKRSKIASEKVAKAKKREKGKFQRLDKFFKESLKDAEEERPPKKNPSDFD